MDSWRIPPSYLDQYMFPEQLILSSVIYGSSLLTILFVPMMTFIGRIPRWFLGLYMFAFVACALGWEFWLVT